MGAGRTRYEILHREGDGEGRHENFVCSRVEDGAEDGLHLEPAREVAVYLRTAGETEQAQYQRVVPEDAMGERTRSVRPAYTSKPVAA